MERVIALVMDAVEAPYGIEEHVRSALVSTMKQEGFPQFVPTDSDCADFRHVWMAAKMRQHTEPYAIDELVATSLDRMGAETWFSMFDVVEVCCVLTINPTALLAMRQALGALATLWQIVERANDVRISRAGYVHSSVLN